MTATPTPSTSTPPLINLRAYLSRIGVADTPEPTLASLKRLHQKHEQSIPFENLDVLLDRPISIELPDIEEKLVRQKRGGYCFEQNTLFAAALRQIGFTVIPYIARVRWMAPADLVTPLSHMVLRVETEQGPQLADVGFGGVGLVEPIALESREAQHLDFEPRRLVAADSDLIHQIQIDGQWRDVYRFTPTLAHPIDLEVANWYSHTHPNARFRNSLLVARLTETGRIIIADTELIQRTWAGAVTRQNLESEQALLDALRQRFALSFPSETRFRFPTTKSP